MEVSWNPGDKIKSVLVKLVNDTEQSYGERYLSMASPAIEEAAQQIEAYANKCAAAELEKLADLARQAEASGFKLRAEAIEIRIKELSSSVALSPQQRSEGDNGSTKPSLTGEDK